MAVVIDLVRAAMLREDALSRVPALGLPVMMMLVLGVNLLAASSVVLTSGLPPLGAWLALVGLRWVGFSVATWLVAGSFYRADVSLRAMLNVIAVAHVGLTAALLPIPEAFQVAGALAWSAAIAVKGMALVIDLDLRTAGASLALGFLATVLVLAVVPVNGLAAS